MADLWHGSHRPPPMRDPAEARVCPQCRHRWIDKYQMDVCPKCQTKLSFAARRLTLELLAESAVAGALADKGVARLRPGELAIRKPGEVSTFKHASSSAMESVSGRCARGGAHGGAHVWRFGKCRNCGIGQGTADRLHMWGLPSMRHAPSADELIDTDGFAWPLSAPHPRRKTTSGSWSDEYSAEDDETGWRPASAPRPPPRGRADDQRSRSLSDLHHAPESAKMSIKSRDLGLHPPAAVPHVSATDKRMECPRCAHRWLDRHGKDECPKCLAQLTTALPIEPILAAAVAEKAADRAARIAEASRKVLAAAKAATRWRQLRSAADVGGDGEAAADGASPPRPAEQTADAVVRRWRKLATRRECPGCGHRWLDKYGKDECPRCLQPLSLPEWRRQQSPYLPPSNSAVASSSGDCPRGGPHTWRLGRCTKCGTGEGRTSKNSNRASEQLRRLSHARASRLEEGASVTIRERELSTFRSNSFLP